MNTNKLSVLVVDDEPAIGLFLKSVLEQVPEVEVDKIITDPLDVADQVERLKPQAVFLDIDMPGLNGIDLARNLRQKDKDLCLIFATAHPDHALEAFELYSFDYILKPFNEERIKCTMQRIKDRFTQADSDDLIIINDARRHILLRPNEIVYIESQGHKIRMVTRNHKEITSNEDIRLIEQRLKSEGFFRCHRSFLVNTSYIRMVDRFGRSYDLVLTSGERIPMSRRQLPKLKEYIQR